MIALVLCLALGTEPACEHPGLDALQAGQRPNACRLLTAEEPVRRLATGALGPIYERSGFEHARQRNTGAFQAFLAQVRQWFESLFGSSGAQTYSNVTRVVVLALALALGGAVTLRFFTRRKRARNEAQLQQRAAVALQLDDPGVHRTRAEQLLESNPREAIREALLSLLSSLERRRFARPDRVKTNRELAEELPRRGAPSTLVSAVAPLFSWFDRAFYSMDAVKPDEARRFLDDVRRLTEQPT